MSRRAGRLGSVRTHQPFVCAAMSSSDTAGLEIRLSAADVRLIVVTMQMDFSGEVGQTVASLLLHIARMERTRIRERQAAGIAAARTNGRRWGGRKPEPTAKPIPPVAWRFAERARRTPR